MSDPLKIAVLYDVWGEEETPDSEAAAESGRKRKEKEDREEIFDALTKLGHEPFYYVLDGRPQTLHGLAKCGADLVFNLTESYAGDDTKEMNVTAYMDLLGFSYTGAGPHAHFLAQDKATAKKMFAFHDIRTPFFATAYRGNIDHAHDVKFPLNSRAYKVTKSKVADDLDEETTQKLSETALAAYRAVKLRDYGRIDMRLTPEGDVYVIEANPNPWLSSKHEFAMAAKKSGRTYTELIEAILEIALERTRVRSKSTGS